MTGLDQGLDIIKDFTSEDIVDLSRLGIGSKRAFSRRTSGDYGFTGTILSRN